MSSQGFTSSISTGNLQIDEVPNSSTSITDSRIRPLTSSSKTNFRNDHGFPIMMDQLGKDVALPTGQSSCSNELVSLPSSSPNRYDLDNNTHSSPVQVPINIQEEIPYISVDGRRKRRRTTFEDAFHQCLTMTMHEDNLIRADDIGTPIGDTKAMMEDSDQSDLANMTGTESVNKKLQYSFNKSSSTDSLPDEMEDGSISSNDSNVDSTDIDCSDVDSMSESESNPICYAPRKSKPVRSLDPVDERIEELIRHSRIKAMIQSQSETHSHEQKKTLQQQQAYEKYKSTIQQSEKDMDIGDCDVVPDAVGANDGSSNGEVLKRKNDKEISHFTGKTTDDSVLSTQGGHERGRSLHRDTCKHSVLPMEAKKSKPFVQSRSNSIPRGMKYSDFEEMEMD
ncbi:predicted protein [Chaetoceros tenuissimus]|uniref:Uncharacterized protein n=1 Tax=Chaetoceros tenuissimus TaxID=426638 RepID=A0AAD3HB58_9STRA|nr:predicted protein [Chaetoceros tenuissimus]